MDHHVIPRGIAVVLVAAMALTSCGPRVVAASRSLPAPVQLDLIRLPRLWVAGFVVSGYAEIDLSRETARLVKQRVRDLTLAGVVDASDVLLTSDAVFGDRAFWQRRGDEYGYPLIVTGTVQLVTAPAIVAQRGRRTIYVHGSGRVLKATVILIDSRTGTVVARRALPQYTRYGTDRVWSAASLYYELMDRALPDWLAAIAAASPQRHITGGGT